MSLDLKLRGGTIVDGTGRAAYRGDVGIRAGRIVEIGEVTSAAKRTIDAEAALITPGFVDIHTHYDAQASWDDDFSMSTRHGVTTAIMGNCGVGCAPCRPRDRDAIVSLLSGVEDIPVSSIEAGVSWDWESFGDYLDAIERRPKAIEVGAYIAHAPARTYVMGERARAGELPTPDECADIAGVVRQALLAGAVGFSTDRIFEHRRADGSHTPDYDAPEVEMLAIADAVGSVPGRAIQFATDFHQFLGPAGVQRDVSLVEAIAKRTRGPISMQLLEWPKLGENGWRAIRDHFLALNAQGSRFRFEVTTRAIGMTMGLGLSMHPFLLHPGFAELRELGAAEQARRMRDPELRRRILSEEPQATRNDDPIEAMIIQMPALATRVYRSPGGKAYEPPQRESIANIAHSRGCDVMEAYYDYLAQAEENNFLYFPIRNYENGNLDVVHEMLSDPSALISFGDAGAHCSMICDSAYTSFALAFWTRDRERRGRISLERLVHLMSGAPAVHLGLADRGVLEVGRRADVNVIDMERLALEPMSVANDLPGGCQRLLQFATGYRAVLVAGDAVVLDDLLTGARPGGLVRGGREAALRPG